MSESLEQRELSKKNKSSITKGKLIIGSIILVVVLFLGFYFGFVHKNAQEIYERSVTAIFDSFENGVTKSNQYETSSGSGKLSYKITSDDPTVNEVLELLNGIDLAYQYQMDYKHNLYQVDLSSDYQKKTLVDATIYGGEDKVYLKLKDIYDKYFVSDVEVDNSSNITYTEDDIIALSHCIKDAIIQSFRKDYFKTVGLNQYVLELDGKKQQEFAIHILKSLKKDQEFLKTLVKMGAKNEDIVSGLDDAISEIKEQEDSSTIKIVLYKKAFSNDISKIKVIVIEDDEKYAFVIQKKDKATYQLEMKDSNKKLFTGRVKIERTEKKKKSQGKISANFDIPETAKIRVSLENNVQYDVDFKKLDIQNSVKLEELTEQEKQLITMQLLKNEGAFLLVQHVNEKLGLFSSLSTT